MRAFGSRARIWWARVSLTGAEPIRTVRTPVRSLEARRSFSRSIMAIIGGTAVSHVHRWRSMAAM